MPSPNEGLGGERSRDSILFLVLHANTVNVVIVSRGNFMYIGVGREGGMRSQYLSESHHKVKRFYTRISFSFGLDL